jgi:small-conductance mechanosensitive channel
MMQSSALAEPPRREEVVDRSTPRRVVEGFLRANKEGDSERAAQFLDLRSLPMAARAVEGSSRAHALGLVLGWTVVLDPSRISNELEGDPSDGPDADVIATVALGDESVPISLTRSRGAGGKDEWLISRATVASVPMLYATYGAPWIGEHMPKLLSRGRFLDLYLWQWLGLILAAIASSIVARAFVFVSSIAARRPTRRTTIARGWAAFRDARVPFRYALSVILFELLIRVLLLNASVRATVDIVAHTCLIAATAWLVMRLIHGATMTLEDALPEDTVGELRSRGTRTRLVLMSRVATILVVTIALSVILMQFEMVRSVGMSLLASAGIAGIVIGVASQRSLGGLIAGIQLSITQPLRIGDTVVVEGESGTVEELRLTYVVVRIWDQRRLIVPVARLLEEPFQNWSRTSTEVLSPVVLYVDYTTPIAPLRAELTRLAEANANWDRRVCKLEVTDSTERALTLRALLSAADSGRSWDLRCAVREGLIHFLQELDGGAYLPHVRMNIDDAARKPEKPEPRRRSEAVV